MDGQAFGEDFDWPTLAAEAGGIGRFIWYLKSSECEFDRALQMMLSLGNRQGRFPTPQFIDKIHFEDQSLVWLALNETLVTGNIFCAEFRFVRPGGEVIWLVTRGNVVDVEEGGQALLGVIYEVSEQRILMQRHELVAKEMEHRVKNLLTIVASFYRKSAERAASVESLSDAFLPRLTALASMNGLAARAGHQEIDLEALVDVALLPVTGRNVTCHIDFCQVNGTMAQTLALVLNELMTNAVKYGGLATGAGGVVLEIRTRDDLFTLTWTETAGYAVRKPVLPTGYGMEVLNNVTAATFSGRASFDWRKNGLVFKTEWPLAPVAVV